MFPINSGAEPEDGLVGLNARTGFDFDLSFDPLFGLMDGVEMPFPSHEDGLLPTRRVS